MFNSSDAKFLSVLLSFSLHLKPNFRYSSLSFVRLSWGRTQINLQNFAQVGLQLKFAFKIWQ